MGMWLSVEQQRSKLAMHAQALADLTDDEAVKEAALNWIANIDDTEGSVVSGEAFKKAIEAHGHCYVYEKRLQDLLENS